MNKVIMASALVAGAVLFVPNDAYSKEKLSPLQIQEMQTHEVEASKNVSFSAVMTVLQDSGYRINAADRETGLITAAASTKSNTTWVPFVGFGKSKKTPVVSAYIEDINPQVTRIRVNFVMTKMSVNNFGGGQDEDPVLDASVYRDVFEKIDQQIFIRQASTSVSPSKATPVEAVGVTDEAVTQSSSNPQG